MNMDREAKEYYEVIIQAKDMGGQLGGLAGTTTVNITLSDVNDNPPRFPQSEYPLCQDGQKGVTELYRCCLLSLQPFSNSREWQMEVGGISDCRRNLPSENVKMEHSPSCLSEEVSDLQNHQNQHFFF